MSKDQLFPVGRIVWGSVDVARTQDFNGNPLLVKHGPNAGQPTQRMEFGVAIPKGPEQAWWETSWGQNIFATAQADFPGGETQRQDFSWKVIDGDSGMVNQNNVVWNTKEGYPGHWVVSFSTSLPVSRHAIDPATNKVVDINQAGEIVPGYFVEVFGSISGNNNQQKPGVFINPIMVCRVGYGARIVSGPNVATAGFGAAVMPAGVSAIPPAGAMQQAPMQQAPMQQAPMQQAPMQQAPMQQAPMQQAPMQQAPMQQAPMQQAPMQQPVQQAQGFLNPPTGG